MWHCIAARQTVDGVSYTAKMVLMPQREERFGLCGPVPSQLDVTAWSDRSGPPLTTSAEGIAAEGVGSIDLYTLAPLQEAPLKTCPGALWGLHATQR